jgi:hypothetical protein
MASERAYVLGTNDEELTRLGVQHRAWRERALAIIGAPLAGCLGCRCLGSKVGRGYLSLRQFPQLSSASSSLSGWRIIREAPSG